MRKLLCIGIVAILIVSVSGCQKTPEKRAVISKADGLPKDTVIPKSAEKKEVNVPKFWEAEISKNNGAVNIVADKIPVIVPEIKNTPVTERERIEFNDEHLETMTDYFRQGYEIRDISEMSKDEIEIIIKKIEEKEGEFGNPDSIVQANAASRLNNLKKLRDMAPVQKELGEVLKGARFGKYKEDAYAFAISGGVQEDLQNMYGENFFYAEVDNGKEVRPKITATGYAPDKGLSGGFQYSYGGYIPENFMEQSVTSDNDEWNLRCGDFLEIFQKKIKEMNLDEKEAIRAAQRVLKDLSIDKMDMASAERVFWTPSDTKWDNMDVDWKNGEMGYKIEFGISSDGLVSYSQPAGTVYQELAEGVYSPVFSGEKIEMVVTQSGIKYFLWKNMTKETKMVAENTKLLSFEEITDFLGKHLMATKVAGDKLNGFHAEDSSNLYYVKSMELRTSFVPAYEEPEHTWLIPVWVFETEGYNINHLNGDRKSSLGKEIVVLSAIDGGYISPVREIDFFN